MVYLPQEENSKRFQDTCDKAWKGLLEGAGKIITSYGTFRLGDLHSISNFSPDNFGVIVLVLVQSRTSKIIPGYRTELISLRNTNLNVNEIVFKIESSNSSKSKEELRLEKAQWN